MEVKVTINEDGTTEIDVNGVQGPDCGKYTNAVSKALGGDIVEDKKKPEYNQCSNKKTVKT
tara:strand:+ start:1088 stop:1270 length:183 start_codon:yes stop_codon:yes gene_type:complete